MAFLFRENGRHGTDGQTDGVQKPMQPLWESCTTLCRYDMFLQE